MVPRARSLPSVLIPLAALALAGAIAACSGSTSQGPPVTFSTFQPASVVIGQPDFTSWDSVAVLSTTTAIPFGHPALAGGILYLPDFGNNRVLGFLGIPTTNGAAADFVIGQPDFVTAAEGLSSTALAQPTGVVAAGGKLLVVDYWNDRVSVFDPLPTGFGAAADVAVGQADLTHDVSSCTAVNLLRPESAHVAGGKLIVADSGHNRVLVWNSIPTMSGVPADLVLGQPNLTSCASNDPQVASTTMYYPTGIWSDGTRLVVADSYNHRVLVWNTFPTVNGKPADLVLGQASFTSRTANAPASLTTAAGLSFPYFLDSNGAQLFVADRDNSRVLVWNTFPTTSGAGADVVLGQGSFTAHVFNDDDQNGSQDARPSARTLNLPSSVKLIGKKLFVTDTYNDRYLIFEGN